MTSPDSGTRPGRVAGIALLGLAAVALVLGLITAFGDSGDGQAGERPPEPPTTTSSSASSKPKPKPTTSKPKPTTTKPTDTKPPTTTTTTGSPSQTRPPGGDGNGEPTRTVPVRVLNNSKIKGLAKHAADDIKADGWQVVEIGNYPNSNVPTTTVYFRPGTAEEAAARTIATDFGMAVEPRITELKNHPDGVIVIVTSDYDGAPSGGKNEG